MVNQRGGVPGKGEGARRESAVALGDEDELAMADSDAGTPWERMLEELQDEEAGGGDEEERATGVWRPAAGAGRRSI